MAFSFKTRTENLAKLKSEHFDLVIIGGGITGSGIARDACSRGLKVALIEAADFAIGTSSRSSKLIHGGVRYLENLEFHLVFEALAERALLFKIAPHLVHPLRFLIPIYKSSRVGYWKMLAGMWLYDLLALFRTPKLHEGLRPKEVLRRVPDIDARELTGAMEYSDAYTDDDRLVIETLRDANRMGAVQASYTRLLSANREGDKIASINVRDELTSEEFSIKGDQFVSGTGPWTDLVGDSLTGDWKEKLRPTKGVHLVFSKKTIPVDRAIVMAVETRIIFVIPRHEMVIVGTTDTDFKDNPKEVRAEREDVAYLLAALNRYFPSLNINESQIISSYAGVRPLVDDGSSSEGKTSREHSIFDHGTNLTFVAGGKYTTYRKISEEAVDFISKKMTAEKRKPLKSSNTRKALNPKITTESFRLARNSVQAWADKYVADKAMVETLVERHGEEARDLLSIIQTEFSDLPPNQAMWMAEAVFAIENTMCLNLVDFYWRRSPLFLAMRDHGIKYMEGIGKVFQKRLGWSDQELEKQKNQFMAQMKVDLHWKTE